MKGNKIFKAAFLVMIISILSRFLGLFRDMLVGYQFGVSIYTDAYKAAVSVPETVFTIVGLAISTVFIPMLSKVRFEKNKEEMFKFSNNIISILLVISVIAFALGFVFTDKIVAFMFDGFNEEKFNLTVFLTRITLFNLLFLSINACYTAMLQVCEDFIIPSILGMFFNAPMIIYLIFFIFFRVSDTQTSLLPNRIRYALILQKRQTFFSHHILRNPRSPRNLFRHP